MEVHFLLELGELMGYIMGKAEGSVAREEWHGHVTALSVAPEFRRLGLAAKLMELLEEISERKGGFFVDLFVRVSNQVAVNIFYLFLFLFFSNFFFLQFLSS